MTTVTDNYITAIENAGTQTEVDNLLRAACREVGFVDNESNTYEDTIREFEQAEYDMSRCGDNSFAAACYNDNSIAELQAAPAQTTADATDCKNWGISADDWREAIQLALLCKFADRLLDVFEAARDRWHDLAEAAE